jgi:peptide/nickel transport system permease protein
LAYIGGRILQALLSILGISTIVFFILHLTGDPVLLMVPQNASQEAIDLLRHQLGLDRPILVQYVDFIKQLFLFDLGHSYVQSQPVVDIILQRLPDTIKLAAAALFLALAIGIPIGMLTAFYRGKWIEKVLMPVILIGQSLPTFWTGILLIMFFSVKLQLLPSSGSKGIESLILPAITLAALSIATFARMTRSSIIEHLEKEYVKTAHSKGVGPTRLLNRHILRNASIPIITMIGLESANLLGGAVITETIFAWPGLGQLTIQAIDARDFPLVQAIVLLVSAIYIFINLITDLLYSWVDPRVRLGKDVGS